MGRGVQKKKKSVEREHTVPSSINTTSPPELSAQAATSHGSIGNVAVRSSAALPTPTQLSAPAGMTGGARPRNQPTHTVVPFYKYNNQARTQAIEYAYMKSATIRHYHILDSRHPPTTSAMRKFEKVYIHPSQASLATRNFGKSLHVKINVL